jgi:hypothetical protein
MGFAMLNALEKAVHMFNVQTALDRWSWIALAALVVMTCGAAFAVNNPVPFIDLPTVPSVAVPGGAGFTLTVNGAGFVNGSVVNWNGSPRATTFVSAAQLTAAILASDITAAGTVPITISNPAPGGGTSNAVYFEVTVPVNSVILAGFQITSLGEVGSSLPPVVVDLNHDGKLDLVLSQGVNTEDATVTVALGNGDGTFQPTRVVGGPTAGFALGDFNGDGNLDIALALENTSPDAISVFLGNGDGTFQPPITTGQGNTAYFGGLLVGDFNQDGHLDIVANGGTAVLLGNGDGTFQPPVSNSSQCASSLVGDVNGDGKLDLVGLTSNNISGQILVQLGNGDGTFQPCVTSPGAAFLINASLADVNGDGKLDLIDWTFEDDPSFFIVGAGVILGNGDGTFGPGGGGVQGFPAFPPGDFNGDGKLDFVVAAGARFPPADDLSVALGNGDGTFDNPVAIQTFTGLPLGGLVQGDFNGDGKMDLLAGDQNGTLMFLQGSFGAGTPSPASLNFGQAIGTRSPEQVVTFTNTGTLLLTLSALNITGTNASEFQQTSNCPTSLAIGAKCQITVTFAPAAVGPRSATLNVPNSGIGNKAVALSGVGTDFSISEPTPNSLTVAAGQTALYTFEVDPIDGFEGGVNLTCSGTPAGVKCLPALATLNGSSGIKVGYRVTTTARTSAMNRSPFSKSGRWLACGLLGLPLIVSLAGFGIRRREHLHRWSFLLWITAAMLLVPACGGGNGGSGGNGSGTPAGTYPLTVAGKYTSGGEALTHTVTLTLVVE